jgi:hypothetical protein
MSHRLKKFLSAVLLLVWLPVYIVVATTIVSEMERPSIIVELAIYAVLGILWALPFRWVFRGVGREDPNRVADADDQR